MRFYCIDDTVQSIWTGTLSEAHHLAKHGKQDGRPFNRTWVRIEEVDVPTDKAGVLAMLNSTCLNEETLRVWTLSSCGDLRKIAHEKCPTCGRAKVFDDGDRYRCDCGATWFKEAQ